MMRFRTAILYVAACVVSAAIGFWFGFREAMPLGVAADFMPRGSIAVRHLEALRAGNTQNLAISLESDVDNGLIWGYDVVNHPLRRLWKPLWGLDVYPEYEQYAVRLANYRRQHPSPFKPDAFDKPPADRPELAEWYKELALGTRENVTRVNAMIERYATKR
jgi:hypothetical protein